jgi:hypothetical protein
VRGQPVSAEAYDAYDEQDEADTDDKESFDPTGHGSLHLNLIEKRAGLTPCA